MPWTAPATRTVGQILTAAFENTQIRDNQLAIDALLDLATGSFTDGGALYGSGTGTITALAVLADGRIHVGDGVTDPVAFHLLTDSTGVVRTDIGGLEFDASAIAAGGILRGAAGIFEILPLGAAQKSLRVNDAGTQLVYDDAVLAGSAGGELGGTYPNPTVNATHSGTAHLTNSAVAKVWVQWEQTGAHGIPSGGSYNMTSVTDDGVGETDHLWDVDFSGIVYALVGMASETGSDAASTLTPRSGSIAATGITTLTVATAGGGAVDATENFLAAYGDQ